MNLRGLAPAVLLTAAFLTLPLMLAPGSGVSGGGSAASTMQYTTTDHNAQACSGNVMETVVGTGKINACIAGVWTRVPPNTTDGTDGSYGALFTLNTVNPSTPSAGTALIHAFNDHTVRFMDSTGSGGTPGATLPQCLYTAGTTNSSLTGDNTAHSILPTVGNGSLTIPAGYLHVGSMIHILVGGFYQTTVAPTWQIKLIGTSQTLTQNTAIALTSTAAVNAPFVTDIRCFVRVAGSGSNGKVACMGGTTFFATSSSENFLTGTTASNQSFDTTVAETIDVTATISTNAGTLQGETVLLEVSN